MKTGLSTFAAVLAFAFGAPALAASGPAVREAALELNQAKWQTDESLRRGMENIREALFEHRHIFHGADDTGTDYGALAAQVTGEVAFIVQNSKLDPLADAELHKLIGQMVSGAEAMEGKKRGVTRRVGAERIAEALADYARLFEHPGW
jgi:hypothetical protein